HLQLEDVPAHDHSESAHQQRTNAVHIRRQSARRIACFTDPLRLQTQLADAALCRLRRSARRDARGEIRTAESNGVLQSLVRVPALKKYSCTRRTSSLSARSRVTGGETLRMPA